MSWPAIPWSTMPVASADVMRKADAEAKARYGIEPRQLMEVAGFQVARFLDEWSGGAPGKRVAVIAGGGNNGGDALVAARFLTQRGAQVVAWIVAGRDPDGLAASHAQTLRAMGVACLPASDRLDFSAIDLIVDGLLGTGVRLPLRGETAALIDAVNRTGLPVVSIDLPSGLQSDSTDVAADVVRAAATVTLGLPKPALATGDPCGRVFLADIGFPPALFGADRDAVASVYRLGSLVELIGPEQAQVD